MESKNGDGHARARINTKSGEVRPCVDGARAAALSMAQNTRVRMTIPYVF